MKIKLTEKEVSEIRDGALWGPSDSDALMHPSGVMGSLVRKGLLTSTKSRGGYGYSGTGTICGGHSITEWDPTDLGRMVDELMDWDDVSGPMTVEVV